MRRSVPESSQRPSASQNRANVSEGSPASSSRRPPPAQRVDDLGRLSMTRLELSFDLDELRSDVTPELGAHDFTGAADDCHRLTLAAASNEGLGEQHPATFPDRLGSDEAFEVGNQLGADAEPEASRGELLGRVASQLVEPQRLMLGWLPTIEVFVGGAPPSVERGGEARDPILGRASLGDRALERLGIDCTPGPKRVPVASRCDRALAERASEPQDDRLQGLVGPPRARPIATTRPRADAIRRRRGHPRQAQPEARLPLRSELHDDTVAGRPRRDRAPAPPPRLTLEGVVTVLRPDRDPSGAGSPHAPYRNSHGSRRTQCRHPRRVWR